MPNFLGKQQISLQPNDASVPYRFEVTVNSTAGANDGFLPTGTTVSSIAMSATKFDGTDATSEMITTSGVSANVITLNLSYPTAAGEGKYDLTFVMTLDTGAVIEANFNRVIAEDL